MNARSACCASFSAACQSYSALTAASAASKMPAAAFGAQHWSHAGRKVHFGNPSQLVLPVSCTTGSRGLSACSGSGQSCASTHGSAAGFGARQPSHVGRGATIISRAIRDDHSSPQVTPPTQHDSSDQQAPQGSGEASSEWGLRAVLVGFAAAAAVAYLQPLSYCADSLITLFTGLPSQDWSITTLASAQLVVEVCYCAVVVCSLSLLCRQHGTSLPALMQLDFKKPLEVLSIASATAVYSIYGAVPVVQAYLRAVYHRLPSPSELQLPPDDIDRILQSGDSAACAMVTLAAVVLAPVVEELIFRGFALQTLVKVWPDRPIVNALVTGAVFGALHTDYPVWGQVACAVSGVFLGFSYLWSDRNLLVPITAHSLLNLVAIITRLNAD